MKHFAFLQVEFVKYAMLDFISVSWNELSYDAQKQYLQKHPGTKKTLSARPGQGGLSLDDVKKKLEEKMMILAPGKGWRSM